MPEGEPEHPTRAKLLFAFIILTTAAQISGFFSRNWACEKMIPFAGMTNVTNCDMQGLFYQCTYHGCYGIVINNGIFFLAFVSFILDLGLGGYIIYRIMISGDRISWIWHNKQHRIIISVVCIISQLLAGIGFFITVHNYDIIGWSAIVFSLPGAALICIILAAIAICCCVCFCMDEQD